ncbi:hypothetical protein KQX54_004504 [Cotesia glomerata]|uniref:Uncharacterized protein n=1 Tax=Cotesia glomerata TaxID=32391 RepID=A0AAV7J7B9_COTGL|nr:hypothetical protein KQX54_004504 [Cotesia glomerata]
MFFTSVLLSGNVGDKILSKGGKGELKRTMCGRQKKMRVRCQRWQWLNWHYGLRRRGNHDDSNSSDGSSSRHYVT